MQVTVKLSSREGAAHVSGILAGFTLLAKRGELTLRVQDVRQGNPLAREALLETEIDGRTVVFDLMDGYFYNDPAAVLALFHRADVVFKRSFSEEKNRQFPGDIPAKLRPLGLNYYVTCPGSPLEAERSAKSRLKQWALSTRCYPQDPGAQKAAHPLSHPAVGPRGAGGAAISGLTGRVAAGERRPH